MLTLDTMLGRFRGGFEATIEDGFLVFAFEDSPYLDAPAEGGDAFLRLANLVRPAGFFDIRTQRAYEGSFAILDRDIGYVYPDASDVLALASEFGPLFGHACADDEIDEVREPIAAWHAAARVLNFAVRAEATLSDPPRVPEGALDGEVVYMVEQNGDGVYAGEHAIAWMATKGFGKDIPEPYREMLDVPQDRIDLLSRPCRFDDDGIAFAKWVDDGGLSVCGCLEAPCDPNLEHASFVMNGADVRREGSAPDAQSLTMQQSLSELMIQQLVAVHLARSYVGWGVVHDEKTDRSVGSVGIQFNSYLERIWYSFGLHHSHGKLGICRHCGKLFSADKERKSTKIYCSKRCQEAEKDERAKARRKRARAEARKNESAMLEETEAER